MDGAIAGVFGSSVNGRAKEDMDGRQLLAEIESVRQGLDMVAARFDFQNDPDLVEACIYEMQALSARYRYLTREARRQGLTRSSIQSLQRLG